MMYKFIKFATISALFLLLAACSIAPQRQALSLQSRQEIKSTKILLNTTQQRIRIQQNNWFSSEKPDPYNLMDSGAIVRQNASAVSPYPLSDIVVDAEEDHKTNESKNTIAFISKKLGGFNYIAYFKNDLSKKLFTKPWLKAKKTEVQYNIKESKNEIVNNSKEDTTLFIGTTYALNSTFERLEVAAYIKLYKKQRNQNSPKLLYKNNFFYIYYLPIKNNSTIENEAAWTQNNAYLLSSKLRDASLMLSKEITDDISNPAILSFGANKKISVVRSINGFKKDAYIVSEKNKYHVLFLKNSGEIYIVNSLK